MALRFWVGGTGTWDASDTTHWAATSGGAGGQSVPGSADSVFLDASSGGGTVTVNFGGLITLVSMDCSAFTGTLDFATNDNSVTLTGSGNVFTGGTTATKTINMGDGTWTLSNATNAVFTLSGANANLTFNANGSTIAFTGAGTKTIIAGGKTFNNITAAASSGTGNFNINSGSSLTASSLSIAAPNLFQAANNGTITTLSFTGTSASTPIIMNAGGLTTRTMAIANNFTPSWCSIDTITFSGGTHVASNSFGVNVSGITVNAPPGSSGSGQRVFGG